MIQFLLNRDRIATHARPGTVLLDLLRRDHHLTGTKQGCREGDCGACSVLVGRRTPDGVWYRCMAACLLPVGDLHGRHVLTIEGLNGEGLFPVQQAIVDAGATQCGFCTPGMVVALTGFLLDSPSLALDEALAAVDGNLCRCTGYAAIRRATQRLVDGLSRLPAAPGRRLETLIKAAYLPDYLLGVAERLDAIDPQAPSLSPPGDAIRVAGGTDLFVRQADRLQNRPLVFLSDDPELQGMRIEQGRFIVGAAMTVTDLRRDDRLRHAFPAWETLFRYMASTPIRNRATLAGNLVNASPIGDLTIALLALGAHLTIRGPGGRRDLSLAALYRGYKQVDLKADERIETITFACPPPGSRFNFEKVSRRQRLDIASVNTAMQVTVAADRITSARLSAGGVAPIPLLLADSSAWLVGQPLSAGTVAALTEKIDAEIAPIDDVRGSADYKRRLLRRLVVAHFVTGFPDLRLEGLLR